MKKILCLTATSGDSHSIAGRAIINGFARRYSSATFRLVDVYKVNSHIEFQFSGETTLVQKFAHNLERQRYRKCKESHNIEKVRKLAEPYLHAIRNYVIYSVKNFQPDIIVCTHIFPAIILSDLKWENNNLLNNVEIVYVECDYVVSPYVRLARNLDYYIAPTQDSIKEFKKYGIKDEDKIINFGIPIIPTIENITPKADARELLNIPNDKYVILVTNGINTCDNTLKLVKTLLEKVDNCYIICICNKNIKLKNKISTFAKDRDLHNLKAFGHTNNLGIIYSASDVVLGKTSGMEVAQAIAKKLPFVATLKIKGQDLDNLKYLKNKGVVVNAKTINQAVDVVNKIKTDKKYYTKIMQHVEKLYKYASTDELVKFLYHNKQEHKNINENQ